jgi:head-tail adaptor
MNRRLSRRLTLEEAVTVPDTAGGFTTTWSDLGRLWAEITPGTGSDPAGEELSLSRVTLRIVCRAAPVGSPSRPRPEQRFREGARLYRILAVTEQDRDGRFLVCFAIEETPQ